jgi:peptidylprolyl isomerase
MIKKCCYLLLFSILMTAVLLVTGCGPASAKNGDTVKVHYTGKLTNGTVFDSSEGGEPLEFTLGQGQLIPGFEQGVIGMKAGESKTITIPADQAYGERRDDMVMEIDRTELPADIDPEVGMQLQSIQPDGSIMVVTIVEVSETKVKLDANNQLAGQTLVFDIKLVEIKKSKASASAIPSMPLEQALANGRPTLAEFGSDTCVPCKQMKPILEQLTIEYKDRLNVVIVDVYEQKPLSQQYNIMAIPTQIFFDGNGREVTRHVGFWAKEEIIAQIKKMGIE